MLKHGFFAFHIVEISPWPILGSMGLMVSMVGLVEIFNFFKFSYTCLVGNLVILLVIYGWMRDIVRESTHQGYHTLRVQTGLKLGFILFIISEVFFFISFFWGLYYSSLSPILGWPHPNIQSINPLGVPLLGTMILISSGVSVTWCHHLILEKKKPILALIITVMLGVIFTVIQMMEYYLSSFSISDGIFGSLFFVSTGFHGIHVMVGTMFLLVSVFRLVKSHYSFHHHVGFEAAAWYWHFVDVVWLFLYISAYWWAN